jgi:hypothetical protein
VKEGFASSQVQVAANHKLGGLTILMLTDNSRSIDESGGIPRKKLLGSHRLDASSASKLATGPSIPNFPKSSTHFGRQKIIGSFGMQDDFFGEQTEGVDHTQVEICISPTVSQRNMRLSSKEPIIFC